MSEGISLGVWSQPLLCIVEVPIHAGIFEGIGKDCQPRPPKVVRHTGRRVQFQHNVLKNLERGRCG